MVLSFSIKIDNFYVRFSLFSFVSTFFHRFVFVSLVISIKVIFLSCFQCFGISVVSFLGISVSFVHFCHFIFQKRTRAHGSAPALCFASQIESVGA